MSIPTTVLLSLRPVPVILDETTDALCYIALKALATFSATSESWVPWSPSSPLANSLHVLGLTPQAEAAWHWLLNRGWIEKHYTHDTLTFRLTPLGTHLAQTPPPPLLTAPAWYRAVLAHLYLPMTPNPQTRPPPFLLLCFSLAQTMKKINEKYPSASIENNDFDL